MVLPLQRADSDKPIQIHVEIFPQFPPKAGSVIATTDFPLLADS
jgi:hypothetical protein